MIRGLVLCAPLATCAAAQQQQTPPAYELEIYEAQDLVRRVSERDPDDPSVVTRGVGDDAWNDPASIELHRGQLIVNQTRELHRKLRGVLAQLRREAVRSDE